MGSDVEGEEEDDAAGGANTRLSFDIVPGEQSNATVLFLSGDAGAMTTARSSQPPPTGQGKP